MVLEDLERCLMNTEQACAEAQVSLAEEFMLEGTVGDQDWLTLLAWKQPHLVYTLPCQFNVQTDQVLFLFLAIMILTGNNIRCTTRRNGLMCGRSTGTAPITP